MLLLGLLNFSVMMPHSTGSQNVLCRLLRIPKTFSKNHWGQNYFMIKEIKERHCLLFSLCWHLHWCCKSNGGQNCLCLRKNQGNSIKCTSSHCVTAMHQHFFFKPVSLKNVLKAVKVILLDLNPWIHIFLTFCATKCEVHIKHFCCLPKYNMLRKSNCKTV